MSAPRLSQSLPLRQLSRQPPLRHRRNLHMTGPATFPSPTLLNKDATAGSVKATTTTTTLNTRTKPDPQRGVRTTDSGSGSSTRRFNTSRALKANNDTSTVDFVYLPTSSSYYGNDLFPSSRVPILRGTTSSSSSAPAVATAAAVPPSTTTTYQHHQHQHLTASPPSPPPPVMRPLINSPGRDNLVSPMSELSDNAAVDIDFVAHVAGTVGPLVADEVGEARAGLPGSGDGAGRVVEGPSERQLERGDSGDVGAAAGGELGRVWRGFVDDLLGEKGRQRRVDSAAAV